MFSWTTCGLMYNSVLSVYLAYSAGVVPDYVGVWSPEGNSWRWLDWNFKLCTLFCCPDMCQSTDSMFYYNVSNYAEWCIFLRFLWLHFQYVISLLERRPLYFAVVIFPFVLALLMSELAEQKPLLPTPKVYPLFGLRLSVKYLLEVPICPVNFTVSKDPECRRFFTPIAFVS